MFFLETVATEGIAQLSYMIGDDDAHLAAIVDPRSDVDVYLELARRREVTITHIFETHIHADFMSGSRELSARCPIAKLLVSGEGGAIYEFEHSSVRDGDKFEIGSCLLRARFTPGHTPEHLAFELCDHKRGEEAWGILTGDSLFVDSAGRPDLLGSEETAGLTKQLYETLYGYYLKLPDHLLIHPGHGAGSACGAEIGERLVSTIGYERRHNAFLRHPNFEQFERFVDAGAPPVPPHYSRLKQLNASGPAVIGGLPRVAGLTPDAFHRTSREAGVRIVDTRHMLAFGGGHVPGAINIGARPELSVWAGQMLDPQDRLLLVLERDDELENVVRLFLRTGFTVLEGYLVGGMTAWENAGLPLQQLPQIPVHDLKAASENGSHLQVLDVRSPDEFEQGHMPGATHRFVADMRKRIDGLDKSRPMATYCASGYRASLAASLMQARGFRDVSNVPGSWEAWTSASYPVERTKST